MTKHLRGNHLLIDASHWHYKNLGGIRGSLDRAEVSRRMEGRHECSFGRNAPKERRSD